MTMAPEPRDGATAGPLALVSARAQAFAEAAKAANTRRAYRADWADFTRWCLAHGLAALPATPQTVALYLSDLAGRCRVSTLARRLATISQAHQSAGCPSPTTSAAVRAVAAGIRRSKGSAPRTKAPALPAQLAAMLATTPPTLLGCRDRALLLLGFAGGFRRGELVSLDVGDIAATVDGLVVTLRRGKTDQEGQGRRVGIPYGSAAATCPVRAVQAWLAAAGLAEGPLLRPLNRHGQLRPGRLSDRAVARVVQRCAALAGLDSTRYGGHSLRAGLATAAAAAGKSERAIMAQTGHRSVPMVRRYIREGTLFRENAAAGIGL